MRKGIKPELLTVADVAKGIVAGALADQFHGRAHSAYEAALRTPIASTAQKRGFEVRMEHPLKKRRPRPGSRKKIDVVLSYATQQIALECKTYRRRAPRINLDDDCAKLRAFVGGASSEFRASGWLLVA